ncbi:MAG: HAD family hydrolase [Bacilli bacterium]|nr:HAD family hydrolase [Bacilli bacterium]
MKDHDIYVFDFDGTLFDTLESLYPTFRYGFDAIGMKVTDKEIEEFTHHSLEETIVMKGIPEKDIELFMNKILEALDIDEFLKMIKPFPEVVEVLAELKKRGKRIAIMSNNNTAHIHKTLRILEFPVEFDVVVGGDMSPRPKPYPDPLFVAFDKMGVSDASKAVYVGDSLQDGETARAAGIDGVVVDRWHRYEKVTGEKCYDLRALIEE